MWSAILLASEALAYPVTYTNCGVSHTLDKAPEKIVTMNQGATEFALALGLADRMVGTAYLDDTIWPHYASDYAKIPVLAPAYPNETTIMAAEPDFIIGSYNSAFREMYLDSKNRSRGIFSNVTVAPCSGAGSEYGEDWRTCRPQLNTAGIGTFLFSDACENTTLRPSEVSEEMVYEEMRQMGLAFGVDAEPLIVEMKADFDNAAAFVSSGNVQESMSAVWVDCVGRCCDEGQVFVGAGQGAPNMLMAEAGLTNVFGSEAGNWACVNESALVAANPDVIVLVDAAWDTAKDKLIWLYNHTQFCAMDALSAARFIRIPFSATTLGPRNGPAALDLTIAALHVRQGSLVASQKSGVGSFNSHQLEEDTKDLVCNTESDRIVYIDDAADVDDVKIDAAQSSLNCVLQPRNMLTICYPATTAITTRPVTMPPATTGPATATPATTRPATATPATTTMDQVSQGVVATARFVIMLHLCALFTFVSF